MHSEISIERLQNFPVGSNCYIIKHPVHKSCLLVDPAQGQGKQLGDYLSLQGCLPQYIIITHEHFDHISSVEHLRSQFGCKVIAAEECSQRITHAKKNLSLFRDGVGFACQPADIIVKQSPERLVWEGYELTFYLTPGHSEGGMCFNIGTHLFTGDTVMNNYNPVSKLPGGSKVKLKNSIEMLLHLFDADTKVFPGHGHPFTLASVSILL